MDAEEVIAIRSAAASYAKQFLVNKYREEYAELYSAYCRNRGLGTRNKPTAMIDERELVSE
jgi:hypothetical protein